LHTVSIVQMDTDARREEIQRRLRNLQREREMEEHASDELCRTVGDKEVVVRRGDKVRVTDDVNVFEPSEKLHALRDPLRKAYLGEVGVVVQTLSDFQGCGQCVEVKFLDDCKHIFSLNCIEGFFVKPSLITRPQPKASFPPSKEIVAETQPALPIAAPSWSSLKKHGSLKSLAAAQPLASAATSHGDVEDEPRTRPCDGAEERHYSLSGVPTLKASAIQGSVSLEPKGSTVAPRAASSEGPQSVSPAPVLALKGTPRAAADDEDDDLLRSPRDDLFRTESWAGEKHFSPAVATLSAVAISQLPSQIPACPPQYIPKFPLGDPRSLIPRPQSESTGVRRCLLTTVEEYATLSTMRHTASRGVAFRSHHSTLDAMLAVCTTELGWGREGKRVTRLFVAPQGQEVMFSEMVHDGAELVASDGAAFVPRPQTGASSSTVQNSARSTTSTVGRGRPTSPYGQRPKLPINAVTVQKPKVVRVFTNGEYGDVQGDLLPYRTVTIRPTCKTLKSVHTLLDRELQWNTLGRHVDMLFTSRGEEITSLDAICDGESIVASSGDRFVIPRTTSILHREIQALDTQSGGTFNTHRQRSPVRLH
jgi:hypothetical protein